MDGKWTPFMEKNPIDIISNMAGLRCPLISVFKKQCKRLRGASSHVGIYFNF